MNSKKPFSCTMLADGSAVMELFTDIGDYGYTVKDFTAALSGVTASSITFRINSYGGEVIEALAIYDLIRASEKSFTAEVFGMCGSAATLIALACDRVELAENATWMVHEMKCGVYGTVADFDKMRETMETLRDKVYGIYEAKTGKDRASLEETCSFDHYMSAQEALDYGFIDGILAASPAVENPDVSKALEETVAEEPEADTVAVNQSTELDDPENTDEELTVTTAKARPLSKLRAALGLSTESERLAESAANWRRRALVAEARQRGYERAAARAIADRAAATAEVEARISSAVAKALADVAVPAEELPAPSETLPARPVPNLRAISAAQGAEAALATATKLFAQ
jgi:ATP-dependent protease ClpP protease subunit